MNVKRPLVIFWIYILVQGLSDTRKTCFNAFLSQFSEIWKISFRGLKAQNIVPPLLTYDILACKHKILFVQGDSHPGSWGRGSCRNIVSFPCRRNPFSLQEFFSQEETHPETGWSFFWVWVYPGVFHLLSMLLRTVSVHGFCICFRKLQQKIVFNVTSALISRKKTLRYSRIIFKLAFLPCISTINKILAAFTL